MSLSGLRKMPGQNRMPAQKPGQSRQDYSTPKEFLVAVERRFGSITFDLAAHRDNHVRPKWYGPGGLAEDSLAQDWSALGGHLWLNPPFGDIATWARKCASTLLRLGATISFLVPASVGANWFALHVWGHAHVIALNGRLSFDGKNPFPKDCILCRYHTAKVSSFGVWDWRE